MNMESIVISIPHPNQEFRITLSEGGGWSVDPNNDDTEEMMENIAEWSLSDSPTYMFFNREDLEALADKIVDRLSRIISGVEIIKE